MVIGGEGFYPGYDYEFLARAVKERVGFIVLDDPILSSDEDYRAYFNAPVIEELLALGVQILLLTQGQRTWKDLGERYLHQNISMFQIVLSAPVAHFPDCIFLIASTLRCSRFLSTIATMLIYIIGGFEYQPAAYITALSACLFSAYMHHLLAYACVFHRRFSISSESTMTPKSGPPMLPN